MSEKPRIGVYICHCGLNIAATVDVKAVAEYAKTLPNVVVARDYVFMCSEPGQSLIKEDIKNYNLNRVVVAACSPSMHEPTFRAAVESAGLNKYLFEMANIREHCSWVHVDQELATEKAKDLIRMAVAKARLLEPLEEKVFPAQSSVMILGGGVAGMRAALELAKYGFEAYLIEKGPALGGKAALIGYIDPCTKGHEVVSKMTELISGNHKIHVFTNAELIDLKGFAGNYIGKVKLYPRFVNENCTSCGECVSVCPIDVANEFEFGISKRKAIFLPFKNSHPPYYVIDNKICNKCGECVKVCRFNAINLNEASTVLELNFGALIIAIGYDPYTPPSGEYGYESHDNIITLLQLKKLLDPEGPTHGELTIGGKVPKSIAFIQCVGSRNTTPGSRSYCSRTCCISAINSAIQIKEKYPDIDVYIIYKDIMTYGDYENLYMKAGESLVKFLKFEDDIPNVIVGPEGLFVDVFEYTIQERIRIPVDAVVLSIGMIPSRYIDDIMDVTRVSRGGDGFLREAHLKLAPLESPTSGMFLAGSITGPKNIMESIRMGSAAASKAANLLAAGKIKAEAVKATVDKDICVNCDACVVSCIFGAIEASPFGLPNVIEANCKGCGVCAAECPMGAMQLRHFKDEQTVAAIDALFEPKKLASSNENFEPVILCFACQWCSYAAADLAGVSRIQYPPNVRILRVPCSGRVDVLHVLRAFLRGADGVIITGCLIGDCHYTDGNVKAKKRVEVMKKSLKALGIDPERLEIEFASSSEGQKFATIMTNFVEKIRKLGPNSLRVRERGD